uniref:Ribosomal protein S4/S9 N-terminal domain-containing protein n=1 Tax=Globodera rostochiensis TaxID=31243 RepID=A0A914HD41_GLORO
MGEASQNHSTKNSKEEYHKTTAAADHPMSETFSTIHSNVSSSDTGSTQPRDACTERVGEGQWLEDTGQNLRFLSTGSILNGTTTAFSGIGDGVGLGEQQPIPVVSDAGLDAEEQLRMARIEVDQRSSTLSALCSNAGGGSPQDEDSSDDGLWNEFETCATSVTHLYRNSNWRTLQQAAASATQLYKSGLECKKRSFDRGFSKGRLTLAKELSSICRYKNKVDVTDIVALLSKYNLLPNGSPSPRQRDSGGNGSALHHGDSGGSGNPVFLFQQALCPASNPASSPHRTGLNNFLQTQVYRHRKRAHSPQDSHSFDFVSKRFKRFLAPFWIPDKNLGLMVDFINWPAEVDNTLHENKIMRRYHVERREHYTHYNKLAREIREMAKRIQALDDKTPNKLILARMLLGKLFDMGVISTADTLERCDKVSASSFCRRRLPVVCHKMQMAPTVRKASQLVEQGHVRVAVEMVTDPAFLVTRAQSDHVTWTRESKIKRHIDTYNNELDDFDG